MEDSPFVYETVNLLSLKSGISLSVPALPIWMLGALAIGPGDCCAPGGQEAELALHGVVFEERDAASR